MPLLYHYEFEIGDNVSFEVSFYDEHYDITDAESLGQIGSHQRRIWAQLAAIDLIDDDEMTLSDMSCFKRDNEFATRLQEENWGQAVVRLTAHDTRILLQIYRLFIFIYLFLKSVLCILLIPSDSLGTLKCLQTYTLRNKNQGLFYNCYKIKELYFKSKFRNSE